MPSHDIHSKVCKILLGRDCKKLDKLIDKPIKLFGGHSHRQFLHSDRDVMIFLALTKNKNAAKGYYTHLLLDRIKIDPNLLKLYNLKKKLF